jgi:hypothetical protein
MRHLNEAATDGATDIDSQIISSQHSILPGDLHTLEDTATPQTV